MQGKATPKKHEGIRVRHSRECAIEQEAKRARAEQREPRAVRCNCTPTYEAWVFDRRAPVVGTDGKQKHDDKTGKPMYGVKIRKTFPTISAAKQWRSDASGHVRRGQLRATAGSVTLRDAAEAWLEGARRGEMLSRYRRPYKPSALRGYSDDLSRYVYPAFGARKLNDLTGDDFQMLVDRLVGSGLSGSKVRNVLVPVQALYRKHRRQVLVDPTDGLDLPEPGGRRERVATPAEAALLIDGVPEEHQAIWAVAFYAGLRLGELQALRVHSIDLEANVLHVVAGWDRVEGEIGPKSMAGLRDVPITQTLRPYLVAHLERSGRRGNDLAFGRTASQPFTSSWLYKRAAGGWAALAVGAFLTRQPLPVEISRITPHECRHSFSTFLDAAGISEARADRYMGHANPSVAARYRHLLPGQLAEDAARLDEYLSGATAGKVVSLSLAAAG